MNDIRQQPDSLNYHFTSECCKFEDSNEVINCINNSTNTVNLNLLSSINVLLNSTKNMITIVTYYTTNILKKYASKSIATLAAYAEQNNYLFYPFYGPNTIHDYAPYDPRWNKIKILTKILLDENIQSNYVVWVDADLIILDFGMKIEMIGSSKPNANIIISKDMKNAPFVSNSGFIIVKNSEWSKSFLEQWWSSYDRTKCCDQNVFTWLYEKMSNEEKINIAILRSDAINTEFPCWKNLQNYNQVLHLAGTSSLYRNHIFSNSFREVCNAMHREPPHLKHQLTINKKYLEMQMIGLIETRINATLMIMNKIDELSLDFHNVCNDRETDQSNHLFNNIIDLRNQLVDVVKFDDHDDIDIVNRTSYNKLRSNELYIIEKIYYLLNEMILHGHKTFPDTSCSIDLLESTRETLSIGFELTIAMTTTNNIESNFNDDIEIKTRNLLFHMQEKLLKYFYICTTPSLTPKVLYYKFKNYQLIAESYSRTYRLGLSDNTRNHIEIKDIIEKIIFYHKQAMNMWNEMVAANYFGSDYVIADPYKEGKKLLLLLLLLLILILYHIGIEVSKELGTYLCLLKKYDEGLENLYISLTLQEKTKIGYESIRITSISDESKLNVIINETMYNINICMNERAKMLLMNN